MAIKTAENEAAQCRPTPRSNRQTPKIAAAKKLDDESKGDAAKGAKEEASETEALSEAPRTTQHIPAIVAVFACAAAVAVGRSTSGCGQQDSAALWRARRRCDAHFEMHLSALANTHKSLQLVCARLDGHIVIGGAADRRRRRADEAGRGGSWSARTGRPLHPRRLVASRRS